MNLCSLLHKVLEMGKLQQTEIHKISNPEETSIISWSNLLYIR